MRPCRGACAVFAGLLLLPGILAAQSQDKDKGKEKDKSAQFKPDKDQKLTTRLRIEVTGGEKSVPVDNASVYVRWSDAHGSGKGKPVEINIKTNHDGVTNSPEIPRGKVLVQVIAEGWKTFGKWFDLVENEQTIKIHLDKPPRWY